MNKFGFAFDDVKSFSVYIKAKRRKGKIKILL